MLLHSKDQKDREGEQPNHDENSADEHQSGFGIHVARSRAMLQARRLFRDLLRHGAMVEKASSACPDRTRFRMQIRQMFLARQPQRGGAHWKNDGMWIMIAGPYTSGARNEADRAANLRAMNVAAYRVFQLGHTPVIGVNMALPVIDAAGAHAHEELMMPISLALAARCDAVLRIGGLSKGADEEVEAIRAKGGKVFTRVEDVPTE